MNAIQLKIVRDGISQLGLYLVLAVLLSWSDGWSAGLTFMEIAVLAHVLSAPVSYWYFQRKTNREALTDAARRQKFEEDAPFRAQRLAYVKALTVSPGNRASGAGS